MYPSNQQQMWESQQSPHIVAGVIGNSNSTNQKLWGGNVRRTMGILQDIFGGTELLIGIAVIFIPDYLRGQDYVGYGIWTGVFAIVTGLCGVFSLKKIFMVIAYMVTCIITAVMSAVCCYYALIGATAGALVHYYARTANVVLYSILCIVSFVQMVISIIGASFTCKAACSTDQPQQVVYYSPQPMPQQCVPPLQYTVNTSQPGLTFHNTAPTAHGAHVSEKV